MNGILLLLPVFLPLVLGLLSYFLPIRSESCRRLVYSLLILGTTALAWAAILLCDDGTFTLLHFSHRLTIAFRMDGAARLFAGLSATLWPFTMLYGFDYMRHEKHLHMFWAFFTASFGVTLGIAFSANMMTMYLFYELLTLATLPLVMQPMTKAAKKAGIKYLVYSISGAALAFIGWCSWPSTMLRTSPWAATWRAMTEICPCCWRCSPCPLWASGSRPPSGRCTAGFPRRRWPPPPSRPCSTRWRW